MTSRIRADLMGAQYFNLGFPCLGVRGGWELIKLKKIKPKMVIVELNSILDNIDYATQLLEPGPPLYLRKIFKVLRKEYSILLSAKSFFNWVSGKSADNSKFWHLPQEIDHRTGKPRLIPEFERQIKFQEASTDIPLIDAKDVEIDLLRTSTYCENKRCASTLKAVEKLIDKIKIEADLFNTHVVFQVLPMPGNENYLALQYIAAVLKISRKDLSIVTDNSRAYSAPDTIHLLEKDAIVYSLNLKENLDKYLRSLRI